MKNDKIAPNHQQADRMKLSEIKRKQIIEAAAEEFRSAGFNGTSMDKVAARANVSKRTVYNHFPSKDALFNGIVDYMLNMLCGIRSSLHEVIL